MPFNDKPCKKCESTEKDKRGYCVACAKAYKKRYNASHKKEKAEYGKAWYRANKARRIEKDKEWRKKNPDKVRAILERFKKNHPGIVGAYSKKYREGHPEITLAQHRRWMNANREKTRESARAYRKKYPIRRREQENTRRCRKMGNGGSYTEAEFVALCNAYGDKCLCCGRGDVKLTADHVVPVTRGGSNNIENIQPLCRRCNSSKGARNTNDYRHKNGKP